MRGQVSDSDQDQPHQVLHVPHARLGHLYRSMRKCKIPQPTAQSHTTYHAILYVSYHNLLLCRPNRKYTTCSKARSRTSLKQSEQLAITLKTSKGSEDWLLGGATADMVVVNGERLSELRGSGSRRQRLTKTLNLNDSIRKLIVHTMLESQTLHILSPPNPIYQPT